MKSRIAQVAERALKVPSNVTASLAEILLESLDHEEDFPVSEEWMAEIRRRCREIDKGESRLIPAEKALAHLHKKYS
jgi:hypothetical protein